MRPIALLATALLAFLTSHDSPAQRQRPQQVQPQPELRCPPPASALPVSPDPYATLERELPSLGVDLILVGAQVERWRAFERAVRVVAELERHRLRQMLPMRDKSREPPQATALIAMLAEIDRRKADATLAVNVNLADLYATLEEKQQRMLDRRVLLSQADPLSLGRAEPRD